MATYDFRVLLETVEGRKFSYYSSSFVNTADNLVLSSSQVYDRITGSVSCSYQNTNIFSSSMPTGFSQTDLNKNYTFKNNTYLSASLTGSFESGSIIFQEPENIGYDKLLRYKFVGSEKVCNVLGLPSNTWVYTDQFRLPADDEANYFEGNVKARNLYVEDSITIANTSTLNSDIPVLIDTGSDRYIKFVDVRDVPVNALIMGYDKDADVYELSGSFGTFNIGGVDSITATDGSFKNIDMVKSTPGTFTIGQKGSAPLADRILKFSVGSSAPLVHFPDNGRMQITGSSWDGNESKLSISFDKDNGLVFRSNRGSASPALIISGGNSGFGVDGGDITEKVQVDGNISASGTIYANAMEITHFTASFITSSTVQTEGNTIFGDTATDSHTFNGHITASGNISSSGANSTFGEVVNLVGEDPRLRLKAVGANHPGIEWHEDSTRKWVLYNDPDEADNLTFKNDSTELIKITQTGELHIPGKLVHEGDTNTFINLTTDDINIQAGGVNFIDITQDSTNEITFNEAGAASSVDIDFRVEGTGDANLLFTDAGNDKVGIGTNTPTKKLQVAGDISASGQYYGEQIIVTHHMSDIDSTSEVFIPAPSYFVDTTANNYTARWIAPYDGELEKILVNSNATPGSTVMTLYAGVAATDKKDSVTVNLNNANRTFTFNCTSGSTISSGDLVRIGYNPSADSDQVSFTCIWKYKIT